MCSLHLTHPSVHTWSSGQPTVQRPGSSRGLPVGAGIRTHNLGSPRVSSPTLYPLGQRLPYGGSCIFSLPVLTLIFPALLPCLILRDSLCTALQTKRLWIWSTGLLMQMTLSETWVSGNLTAPTEHSQQAIWWTRGRGGESCVLRLFPWRKLKISTYSEPW